MDELANQKHNLESHEAGKLLRLPATPGRAPPSSVEAPLRIPRSDNSLKETGMLTREELLREAGPDVALRTSSAARRARRHRAWDSRWRGVTQELAELRAAVASGRLEDRTTTLPVPPPQHREPDQLLSGLQNEVSNLHTLTVQMAMGMQDAQARSDAALSNREDRLAELMGGLRSLVAQVELREPAAQAQGTVAELMQGEEAHQNFEDYIDHGAYQTLKKLAHVHEGADLVEGDESSKSCPDGPRSRTANAFLDLEDAEGGTVMELDWVLPV